MGNTPLDFEKGITQWRIRPLNGAAYDGSYVWTLGYDGLADRIEDLAYNDYIQISQAITITNVEYITARVHVKQPKLMPNYKNISKDVQFVAESSGSPGNRMVIPSGIDDSYMGRTIAVSGATNGANNGNVKIVGIANSITAYVNKVLVTEGPRSSIVAIAKGSRWKMSLLVDDPTSVIVERARVVQNPNETAFYRSDLKMNVARLTGTKNIYFRLTLIEHTPNNIYTLP